MALIDRYILKAVLAPTALAFVVVTFLVIANELREQSYRLIVQVLTVSDIALLSAAFLPSLLPLILPVTLFFGILMGYGRLAERGEITAIRAAGVSLLRLVAPAVVLGLLVSILTIVLQDRLQPRTMAYALNFLRNELPRRATLDVLGPGIMHPFGDHRVYFASRDPNTHVLHDVTVVRREDSGVWVFRADSAEVVRDEGGSTLILKNGHSVTPDGMRGDFENWKLSLPQTLSRAGIARTRMESSISELLEDEHTLTRAASESSSFSKEKALRETRHEIADRICKPFAAALLACVGAPLAAQSARYRRGGRQRLLAVGLLPVFVYYAMYIVLDPSTLWSLRTTLWVTSWPNLALLVLAAAMYVRTARAH